MEDERGISVMNHRIAMVTTVHPHDDVRIYHKEAKTLVEAGWRVEIINPEFEGSDENGIRFRRVTVPSSRIGRMLNARKAAETALRESRADICILHDPELLPLLATLKNLPIQTVYDAHEDLPAQLYTKPWIPSVLRGIGSSIGQSLLERYLPYADGVIAATEGIAKNVEAMTDMLCVIRNRPTSQDFVLFDIERSRIKRLPRAVCYAGALSEQRGLQRMIRCCHQAEATLMLAGKFESEFLQKKVQGMPEYSSVKYLGVLNRQEIAELYAKCNAGLLLLDDTPAYRASEPIKLFEYLCAGLPVIASDFSHWRNIASLKEVSFVKSDSNDEIVSAISNALKYPVEIDVEAMRQNYGFKNDADKLIKFYQQLEEKGR